MTKSFVVMTGEDVRVMERAGIRLYDGWVGAHSRNRAEGAIANGTAIKKQNSEPEDQHRDGTNGIILGSVSLPSHGIMYFVEWQPLPRYAVSCVEKKVTRVS